MPILWRQKCFYFFVSICSDEKTQPFKKFHRKHTYLSRSSWKKQSNKRNLMASSPAFPIQTAIRHFIQTSRATWEQWSASELDNRLELDYIVYQRSQQLKILVLYRSSGYFQFKKAAIEQIDFFDTENFHILLFSSKFERNPYYLKYNNYGNFFIMLHDRWWEFF